MRTTTFGTGQLILAALDAGARRIVLGIGNSATVDGGCGCAQALGVLFLDESGQPLQCGLAGGGLSQIMHLELDDRDPRIAQTEILVACDVKNPLTGPQGAAAVYGPQKGATPEMVRRLDEGLAHLAEMVRRDLKLEINDLPGAGGGLVAFAGARLCRGVEIVAQAVDLRRRLGEADLVLTGEGRLDGSSSFGKTAVGVARLAQEASVPVICIPGQAAGDAPNELFAAVHPLVVGEVTPAVAMRRAEALLQLRAAEAIRRHLNQ